MLRTLMAAAIFTALAGAAAADPVSRDPAKAPAGTYALDKRHASLIAKIPHMGGFSKFTVRFRELDGGFTYDPANWRATKLSVTIDPKSIDTNLPSFNEELAGPRYFNAPKYPTITFVSTAIAGGEDGHGQVTGDLTFMGKTKPVTLDVDFNGAGPGLLGAGTRMGFSATGRIKRSDFGLNVPFAGDDVDLVIEVEFVKK